MLTPKLFILFSLVAILQLSVVAQNKPETKSFNHWQTGISFGRVVIKGEVTPLKLQPGWMVFVRKPVKKWLAFQVQYSSGIAKGINSNAAFNYGKNTAWASRYNAPVLVQEPNGPQRLKNSADGTPYTSTSGDPVYYNYRTYFHQLSIQTRLSYTIETIKPRIGIYGVIGVGGLSYNTKVDALDKSGSPYTALFRSVYSYSQTNSSNRTNVLRDLNAGMDHVYETNAERVEGKRPFNRLVQTGIGISMHVSERFHFEMEYLYSFTNQTLLDGQRWSEKPLGAATIARKFDGLVYTGIILCYRL